jgi:hypothetical protein
VSGESEWHPPGTNGWTTFRPAEPCGKRECQPMTFDHSTAPTPQLDVAELEAREDAQRFRQEAPEDYDRWVASIHATNERFAEFDYETSLHEAAHACMTIAVGGTVKHLQLAGQPYCEPSGIPTVADSITMTIAGDIGSAIAKGKVPTPGDVRAYLRKACKGNTGPCDSCLVSKRLREVAPHASSDTLVEVWEEFHARAVRFFERPEVRAELDKLAAVLRDRRMMPGAEVHALVNADVLRAARVAIETN